MTELDQLIAEAEPLRLHDPDERLGAIVDRINAIRNGAQMAPAAVVEGADALLPADPMPTEEDERAALIAVADARGVKIDKRWSTERILKALE